MIISYHLPIDPCAQVMCDRGRMCVSTNGVSTTCVCPESCTEADDPVCSVYNRHFNNTCEMHKFACRFGFFTSVKNKGVCKGSSSISLNLLIFVVRLSRDNHRCHKVQIVTSLEFSLVI